MQKQLLSVQLNRRHTNPLTTPCAVPGKYSCFSLVRPLARVVRHGQRQVRRRPRRAVWLPRPQSGQPARQLRRTRTVFRSCLFDGSALSGMMVELSGMGAATIVS